MDEKVHGRKSCDESRRDHAGVSRDPFGKRREEKRREMTILPCGVQGTDKFALARRGMSFSVVRMRIVNVMATKASRKASRAFSATVGRPWRSYTSVLQTGGWRSILLKVGDPNLISCQ